MTAPHLEFAWRWYVLNMTLLPLGKLCFSWMGRQIPLVSTLYRHSLERFIVYLTFLSCKAHKVIEDYSKLFFLLSPKGERDLHEVLRIRLDLAPRSAAYILDRKILLQSRHVNGKMPISIRVERYEILERS